MHMINTQAKSSSHTLNSLHRHHKSLSVSQSPTVYCPLLLAPSKQVRRPHKSLSVSQSPAVYCPLLLALSQAARQTSSRSEGRSRPEHNAKKSDHKHPILRTLYWLPVTHHIQHKMLTFSFSKFHFWHTPSLSGLLSYTPTRQLRSPSDIRIFVTPRVN